MHVHLKEALIRWTCGKDLRAELFLENLRKEDKQLVAMIEMENNGDIVEWSSE